MFTSINFCEITNMPGKNFVIFFISRQGHTPCNFFLCVSEELPQRERGNSWDPFAVAMTTDELIVGHQKFLQFARCFYNKMGQFSSWLNDNMLGILDSSERVNFQSKKFL